MTMPKHHKVTDGQGMVSHHKRFDSEKLKSGRSMMEHIEEVDWKDIANEEVKQVDMSQEPEDKGKEWQ